MSIIILGLLACTTSSTIGPVIKDIISMNEIRRLRSQLWRDSMRRHPAYQTREDA